MTKRLAEGTHGGDSYDPYIRYLRQATMYDS